MKGVQIFPTQLPYEALKVGLGFVCTGLGAPLLLEHFGLQTPSKYIPHSLTTKVVTTIQTHLPWTPSAFSIASTISVIGLSILIGHARSFYQKNHIKNQCITALAPSPSSTATTPTAASPNNNKQSSMLLQPKMTLPVMLALGILFLRKKHPEILSNIRTKVAITAEEQHRLVQENTRLRSENDKLQNNIRTMRDASEHMYETHVRQVYETQTKNSKTLDSLLQIKKILENRQKRAPRKPASSYCASTPSIQPT